MRKKTLFFRRIQSIIDTILHRAILNCSHLKSSWFQTMMLIFRNLIPKVAKMILLILSLTLSEDVRSIMDHHIKMPLSSILLQFSIGFYFILMLQ